MFCQLCGAANDDEAERCRRCGQKLLVVSGPAAEDEERTFEPDGEGQLSFDEHLLERISILEEVVKRSAQAMRRGLGTLHQLEQKILLNHAGLLSLREVLDEGGLVDRSRWTELWESRLDRQLLALEKRDRFAEVKERIAGLYRGRDPGAFAACLDEAEHGFFLYNMERAVGALQQAEELDPENYELAYFLAETFFNEGVRDAALDRFLRVLELKPGHIDSLVYAGVLLHQDGDEERAESLLAEAVERHPEAFMPRFALGAILSGRGELERAAALLEEAVERPEAVPQAWYLLGCCRLDEGKAHPALVALERAVEMDSTQAEARLALAVAYLDRGWNRLALESAHAACDLRPECLEYRELVDLLRPEGHRLDKDAVDALRRAEEAIFAADEAGAVTAYRDAVRRDPTNPTLRIAYAMACLELGRLSEIEPALDAALGLDPGADLEAAAWATQIEALRADRRPADAARLARDRLERAESEDSSRFARGLFAYELAVSLCELGDAESVVEALRCTVESEELLDDELRRFPLDARGWIFTVAARDAAAEAVDCLSTANELGSSARILTHLGIASLAAGDRETARFALDRARRERERGGLPERLLGALRDGPRLFQDADADA